MLTLVSMILFYGTVFLFDAYGEKHVDTNINETAYEKAVAIYSNGSFSLFYSYRNSWPDE